MNTKIWPNDATDLLIDTIEFECVKQEVDESRRGFLFDGWNYARECAARGEDLTLETYLEIARRVEPDNHGRLRQTPVTFANGGYAVPADAVLSATEQAIRFWPGVDAEQDEIEFWTKEFLIVHGLVDGNGRSTWVLYQWLNNAWDAPLRLPYYFGEG